jgi:hypothetical protein
MAEKNTTEKNEAKPSREIIVDKKIDKPKPSGEIKQPVEPAKSINLNWDVIGLSSAAVTLSGAALVFMIGWIHEANWFAYFGISLSQLTLSPQYIFAQSLPTLFISCMILGFSLVCNIAWEIIRNLPIEINSFQSIRRIVVCYYFFFIMFLGSLVVRLANRVKTNNYSIISYFNSLPSDFILFVSILFAFIFIFYLITKLKNPNASNLSNSAFIVLVIIILITFLSMAAFLGFTSAAQGFHQNGAWEIQPVYLVSNKPLLVGNDLLFTCQENQCFYGPFGLIAQSDTSYFLIRWKNLEADFPIESGLFIFPRNQDFYFVPSDSAKAVQENFQATISTPIISVNPSVISTPTP